MRLEEALDLIEKDKQDLIDKNQLKEWLEELKHNYLSRDICWYCGGQLCWNNDFDLSDITGDETDQGIVTYLTCVSCGAQVEYMKDEKLDIDLENV